MTHRHRHRWIQSDDGRTAGVAADDGSTEQTGERVWLVERGYTDGGPVTLVYTTADGDRQLSKRMVVRSEVTAGRTVDPDRLEPTPDAERARYDAEAGRMARKHDPTDTV